MGLEKETQSHSGSLPLVSRSSLRYVDTAAAQQSWQRGEVPGSPQQIWDLAFPGPGLCPKPALLGPHLSAARGRLQEGPRGELLSESTERTCIPGEGPRVELPIS